MHNLDKLISRFERFPGVGTRQARRFAFHILTMSDGDTQSLSELIASLKGTVTECHQCRRFFSQSGGSATECEICRDLERDSSQLLVVSQDSDITPIERSGVYTGKYFVLGGTIPILTESEKVTLRSGALKALVETRSEDGLREIILGFAVNPDGENTGRYVEHLLEELIDEHDLKVSKLGRGLSTGSELEYADPETIKNALKNRA